MLVLGIKVLLWMLSLERLYRRGSCHAIRVEIGSAGQDPETIPGLWAVLSPYLSLEMSLSMVR